MCVGRRRIRIALVAVGIAVSILAGMELGLRAMGVKPHGGVLLSADGCYFGWEPYARDTHTRGHLRHDLVTDANGFRVAVPIEAAAEPACRVLALGDSFTEGMYVTADEAWPAVLQSLLGERGYRVHVDNGGMRGHSILQERIAALGRWQALHPTIVVVEHTANDLMDLSSAEAHGCRAGGPVSSSFHSATPRILRSLRLFRIAQELGIRIESQSAAAAMGGRAAEPVAPAECERLAADYLSEAIALAEGVRRFGGHLLFGLWEPLFCESAAPPDLTPYTMRLRTRLASSGAAFLDATDVFQVAGATLRPEDGHPSVLGHRLFAERVATALDQSGWLTQCRVGDARQ